MSGSINSTIYYCEGISSALAFLESHSIILIAALLVLPTFGFPTTALYILAGLVFGVKVGLSLCILSIISNILLSSVLYKSKLNEYFVKKFYKSLNSINASLVEKIGQIQFILAIKLIPTFPFIIQNYILLNIGSIKLTKIVTISILVDGPWAYCCITGGNAVKNGSVGLIAVLVVTIFIILSKLLYNVLYKHKITNSDNTKA